MLKSVTPIPMLLIAFMMGKEKPYLIKIFLVAVISAGVAISTVGELEFSVIGFTFQAVAMFSDVIRINLLDILLSTESSALDPLSTIYYITPPSFVLITLGFFIFEYPQFSLDRLTPIFCLLLLLNGMLAFALNISAIFVIKETSAMTLSLAGLFKDMLIVLSSVIIFHSPLSSIQVVGYGISIMGLNLYKQHKQDPELVQVIFKKLKNIIFRTTDDSIPEECIHDDVDGGKGEVEMLIKVED